MWKGLSLLAAAEAGSAIRRSLLAFGLYVVAGLLATMALVFGLIALQTWLSFRMSDMAASLVIAGGLVCTALVVAISAYVIKRRRRQSAALTTAAVLAAPLATKMIGRHINGGTLAVISVMALGALAGRALTKD